MIANGLVVFLKKGGKHWNPFVSNVGVTHVRAEDVFYVYTRGVMREGDTFVYYDGETMVSADAAPRARAIVFKAGSLI